MYVIKFSYMRFFFNPKHNLESVTPIMPSMKQLIICGKVSLCSARAIGFLLAFCLTFAILVTVVSVVDSLLAVAYLA